MFVRWAGNKRNVNNVTRGRGREKGVGRREKREERKKKRRKKEEEEEGKLHRRFSYASVLNITTNPLWTENFCSGIFHLAGQIYKPSTVIINGTCSRGCGE